MRPFGLIILLFSIYYSPLACFAYTRQEIVDEALTEQETSATAPETYSPAQNTYFNPAPYLDENKRFFGDPVKADSGPWMSEKRKKIIDDAFAGFSVSAGYDYNHIHYSEWQSGAKLDEDFGYQDGLYANIGYKSNRYLEIIKSRPFVNLYYRNYSDIIKYKGATIGPPSTPYNVNQRSKIEVLGFKLGGYRDFSDNCEFFAYLDFGRRTWHRGENEVIDGVLNYYERYKWAYYGPGIGLNYKVLPKLSVGLEAKWMFAISPEMWADLYEGGMFKLHNVTGGEISIPLRYYLFKNFSIDLTPYYTYWRINESDPVTISGTAYVEPDSRTHEEGLLIGLSCFF